MTATDTVTATVTVVASETMVTVSVYRGDITAMDVDVIVNAANSSLLGGGGVDGAIHRAAGPELLAECRRLHGCRTGDAKTTGAGRLAARHVVHTVGPVWHGGGHGEAELLASCYRRSLEEAAKVGAKTVAIPAISTGVYRFPRDQAAAIACREVQNAPAPIETIFLVAFDEETSRLYADCLGASDSPAD